MELSTYLAGFWPLYIFAMSHCLCCCRCCLHVCFILASVSAGHDAATSKVSSGNSPTRVNIGLAYSDAGLPQQDVRFRHSRKLDPGPGVVLGKIKGLESLSSVPLCPRRQSTSRVLTSVEDDGSIGSWFRTPSPLIDEKIRTRNFEIKHLFLFPRPKRKDTLLSVQVSVSSYSLRDLLPKNK